MRNISASLSISLFFQCTDGCLLENWSFRYICSYLEPTSCFVVIFVVWCGFDPSENQIHTKRRGAVILRVGNGTLQHLPLYAERTALTAAVVRARSGWASRRESCWFQEALSHAYIPLPSKLNLPAARDAELNSYSQGFSGRL
jgi:hypothetical protein